MNTSHPTSFVFISYSRADREFVTRLKDDLQAQGITLWIDTYAIQPGTADWEDALRVAIRSADAVLYIASANARASRYVKAAYTCWQRCYQSPNRRALCLW